MTGTAMSSASCAAAAALQLVPINRTNTASTQSVRVNRNGTLEISIDGVYTLQPGKWSPSLSPTVGDSYQVRMDTANTWSGSSQNTWLAMQISGTTFNREFINSGAPQTVSGTLRIRRIGEVSPMISVAVSFTNNQ